MNFMSDLNPLHVIGLLKSDLVNATCSTLHKYSSTTVLYHEEV